MFNFPCKINMNQAFSSKKWGGWLCLWHAMADLPPLHLPIESPEQSTWRKLALDSLGSPRSPHFQKLARDHWRRVRKQVISGSFISGLQRKIREKQEESEGEEYNIYSSSNPSSPKSPHSPWNGDGAGNSTSHPHVLLLQTQLQEAAEEIERLYTEKDDVEHELHQVRRSSLRLEQAPSPLSPRSPEGPDQVSVACQCGEMPMQSPYRLAFPRGMTSSMLLSPEGPESEAEKLADLLSEERRLMTEEVATWEIERKELEDEQAELKHEMAAALLEAEAAVERSNVQEVQMKMWKEELAEAREQEDEFHYRSSMHFCLMEENLQLKMDSPRPQKSLPREVTLTILSRLQMEESWILLRSFLTVWHQISLGAKAERAAKAEEAALTKVAKGAFETMYTLQGWAVLQQSFKNWQLEYWKHRSQGIAAAFVMRKLAFEAQWLQLHCLKAWQCKVALTQQEALLSGTESSLSTAEAALAQQLRALRMSRAALAAAKDAAQCNWAKIPPGVRYVSKRSWWKSSRLIAENRVMAMRKDQSVWTVTINSKSTKYSTKLTCRGSKFQANTFDAGGSHSTTRHR